MSFTKTGLSKSQTLSLSMITVFLFLTPSLKAQVVIPGSGLRVRGFGDNFEAKDWEFTHNFPKSSYNLDKKTREPLGYSSNGLWFESAKRGQPDVVKIIAPPKGGILGSKGALLMRSLSTGIPGRRGRTSNQDDFLFDGDAAPIPISKSPSVVVRVYFPPFKYWENSTDTSFGFRAALQATATKKKRRLFRLRRVKKKELFYPGMFIQFNSETDADQIVDSAFFIIRGDNQGQDVVGPEITQTGWWTLGMSFTPDGKTHYFASPGVDDLTMADHIYSAQYRGLRFENFQTFFFDIVSKDNGRSWSTPWIVDDPWVHVGQRARFATRSRRIGR